MYGAIQPISISSLAELARNIEHHGREGYEYTLKAVMLLREARERVARGETGDITWWKWAEQNVELKPSRLRLLMQIAYADDPVKEHDDILEQGRRRSQTYRRRQKEAKAARAAIEPARRALHTWVDEADIIDVSRVLDAIKAGVWPAPATEPA